MRKLRCSSVKDHSWIVIPDMTYVRPRPACYYQNLTPAKIEYHEKYGKEQSQREYRCSDTKLMDSDPPKLFVKAWNTIITRKTRYLPIISSNVNSEVILEKFNATKLYDLVEKGDRLDDFDAHLFRNTVERVDVIPPGKLTFVFKAGIKITV